MIFISSVLGYNNYLYFYRGSEGHNEDSGCVTEGGGCLHSL